VADEPAHTGKADAAPAEPTIALNDIRPADLWRATAKGFSDFLAAPGISVGIAAVYTLGGWLLAILLTWLDLPYLVYPLAMGFALIAPFVAVGFYEVSRERESGIRPSFGRVLQAVSTARRREIRWMALITAFAFFIWMDIAAMITLSFFGATALDFDRLIQEITTTQTGLIFLVVGHVVGAMIALAIFSISVVTYPMLHDREVDVITAMSTSLALVSRNPITLAVWCTVIASAMMVAIGSALLLLPVVLPVLGYASWHLYRHAVPAI